MAKRNQIQIAIDALKKQQEKYKEQYQKALEAKREAIKSEEFFLAEIKRLDTQINSLEGTNAGNGQHAAVSA